MKLYIRLRYILLSLIILLFVTSACASAATRSVNNETPVIPINTPSITAGIGILGDSTSDEYRADDERGGQYADTTLNWMELLIKNRGLNFGKWGTWGEPRRTGYEYNWARTGATINSMITSGQHTGLAKQVAEGKVSYVLIWIGNNDFHLKNGPYEEIYSGTLSDADLQKRIDHMVGDLTTAMDTILQAGDVKIGIMAVADQGLAPQAKILFPDASKRKRVTDAVNNLNARIAEVANERGVLVIDSNAVGQALFGRVDMFGELTLGNQKISVLIKGNEPHHLQLEDNIGHAGTVLSGIVANSLFLEPFNHAFGLGVSPLTDEEILQDAGIAQ